jgi:hypothetical protein
MIIIHKLNRRILPKTKKNQKKKKGKLEEDRRRLRRKDEPSSESGLLFKMKGCLNNRDLHLLTRVDEEIGRLDVAVHDVARWR